ncbi:hypothetical protein, partial [Ralstonia pseudosolanacearum]|uniref:hypothetical protein n=1 Tax=Ralstonia pseudosolanacearum TaxID=1310165 RepID=UPI0020063D07
CMFPAKIENLRRNPVCLQRYRHVVARKRQHGLTTTLIYATTPFKWNRFSSNASNKKAGYYLRCQRR